jgi:WD40 repeat protein
VIPRERLTVDQLLHVLLFYLQQHYLYFIFDFWVLGVGNVIMASLINTENAENNNNQNPSKQGAFTVSFNQDATCFSTGLRNRSCVYSCMPFQRHEFASNGGIGAMAMLYRTNLLAMCGGGDTPAFSPRRLRVVNTTTKAALCELLFETTVLSVKMNRERLVVALQNKIHVFDLDTMTALHMLQTPPNTGGLMTLQANTNTGANNNNDDSCNQGVFLAFPGGTTKGELVLFDVRNLKIVKLIQAHQHPLTAMELSQRGRFVATASTEGTIIRVFKVPSGERLHTFRRGTRRGIIRCLSFDISGKYLCVGSASGTIHFYKNKNNESNDDRMHQNSITNNNNKSNNSSRAAYISSYISSFMPENLDTTRSFAQVRLRTTDAGGVPPYHCAIMCDPQHKNKDEVANRFFVTVVSLSGIFSLYSVNKITGETQLEEENALFETQSDALDAKFME